MTSLLCNQNKDEITASDKIANKILTQGLSLVYRAHGPRGRQRVKFLVV